MNYLIAFITKYINFFKNRKLWRKNNATNFTTQSINLEKSAFSQISVGKYTYGKINLNNFAEYKDKLFIGSFCSIASNVQFFLGGEHKTDYLSTYPFIHRILSDFNDSNYYSKGSIVVNDDVWIGYGATILSGVHIGQGAVIGANTTVAKDVPPYAIYAGNRIVKYRFSEEIIEKLMKFDYNKLTEEDIKNNLDLLYKEIDDSFFETDFYKIHLKDE